MDPPTNYCPSDQENLRDNPLPFPTIPTTLKFNDETDDFEFLDIELSFDRKIINEKLILDTYFLF